MDYKKMICSGRGIECYYLFLENCVRDCAIVTIYSEMKREMRKGWGKRRGTRDSTFPESIREKNHVGQLTKRRTISGSERGIKGAWEL